MKVPTLETPRLQLIALNDTHLNDLFDIYKDEESMKYWDDFAHQSIDETKKLLDFLAGRIEKGTGICWGIVLKENRIKEKRNTNSSSILTIKRSKA